MGELLAQGLLDPPLSSPTVLQPFTVLKIGFFSPGPVSYAFSPLSLCFCLSPPLTLAPDNGAASFHPGCWAAHPGQGRPDGGAIPGIRAFGTG